MTIVAIIQKVGGEGHKSVFGGVMLVPTEETHPQAAVAAVFREMPTLPLGSKLLALNTLTSEWMAFYIAKSCFKGAPNRIAAMSTPPKGLIAYLQQQGAGVGTEAA